MLECKIFKSIEIEESDINLWLSENKGIDIKQAVYIKDSLIIFYLK